MSELTPIIFHMELTKAVNWAKKVRSQNVLFKVRTKNIGLVYRPGVTH